MLILVTLLKLLNIALGTNAVNAESCLTHLELVWDHSCMFQCLYMVCV